MSSRSAFLFTAVRTGLTCQYRLLRPLWKFSHAFIFSMDSSVGKNVLVSIPLRSKAMLVSAHGPSGYTFRRKSSAATLLGFIHLWPQIYPCSRCGNSCYKPPFPVILQQVTFLQPPLHAIDPDT